MLFRSVKRSALSFDYLRRTIGKSPLLRLGLSDISYDGTSHVSLDISMRITESMLVLFCICSFSSLPPSSSTVHHFNLGRRVPGFDYGPDAFGTGLTPLHLSDDGEGGAFHFQEPPPPYAAYKYPDIQHPDDPPPPYEASINPDRILYVDLGKTTLHFIQLAFSSFDYCKTLCYTILKSAIQIKFTWTKNGQQSYKTNI